MTTPRPLFDDAPPTAPAPSLATTATVPASSGALVAAQSTAPTVSRAVAVVTRQEVDAIDQRGTDAMGRVSQGILEATKASAAGEMGDLLNQLVITAKGLDPKAAPSTFLGKLLHKAELTKERALSHYQSVQQRMNTLVAQVRTRCDREQQRIGELEHMEDANMQVMRERTEALKQIEALHAQAQAWLAQVDAKIHAAGDQADFSLTKERTEAQEMVDFTDDRADNCRRLILLAKQRAPQIRIMIDNARSLVQKFDDIQTSVIPAWSDRLSLYITQMDQKGAAELANSIFEASDDALRKQADALRQSTAEIATLRRHTVASNDTLEYVNQQLIGTLDDMNKAAEEERRARIEAQAKLRDMEGALVQRLLKPQAGEVLQPKAAR